MAVEPADDMWDKYRISPWTMPNRQAPTNASPPSDNKQIDTPINSNAIKKLNSKQLSFALEAENFSRKIDKPAAAWEVIVGLGRTGKGSVAVYPVTAPRFKIEQLAHDAPRLEYDVALTTTGGITLHVYLIPTHPLVGTELKFAVALNDEAPHMVAFDVQDGSADWGQGVLNATRIATTTITVNKTGKQVLKFYGVDAGVLLDKIVLDIDGVAPSYLGLPVE